MSSKAERCPLDANIRTGLKLAHDDYQKVADTFASFAPPTDSDGNLDQGGCPRNKTVRTTPYRERLPTYEVQASFGPQQLAYIDIVSAALNMLAQGRVIHQDKPAPVLPLERAIQVRYLSEGPSQGSFFNSTATAVYDIFTAFGSIYPNLMPAAQSASSLGLVPGTALATTESGNSMRHMKHYGKLPDVFRRPESTARNFTGVHYADLPGAPNAYEAYEVWCLGIALARTIMSRSGRACETLIRHPDAQDLYDFTQEVAPIADQHITEKLQRIIGESAAAAHIQYGRQ